MGYLKSAREAGLIEKANDEFLARAAESLNASYQALLRFQTPDGGFSLWGNGDGAYVSLTAYGLMEFADMGKVHEVDPTIVQRAQAWLAGKQQADGAWKEENLPPHNDFGLGNDLTVTSYVAWGMARSGYRGEPLDRALAYLTRNLGTIEEDSYLTAMAAQTFLAAAPESATTDRLLTELTTRVQQDGENRFWQGREKTLYHGSGQSAAVEATGLAAMSLLSAQRDPTSASGALAYLVSAKGGSGGWGSTSATVLALQAIVAGMGPTRPEGDSTVRVFVGESPEPAETFRITPDDFDVMRMFNLTARVREAGSTPVRLEVDGKTNLVYQLVTRYHLPWDGSATRQPLSLAVEYDRTSATVGESIQATVSVTWRGEGEAFMAVAEIGVPPGFSPSSEDLERLVSDRTIQRFETSPDRLVIYIEKMTPGSTVRIPYRLTARLAVEAQTPPSSAYLYYAPAVRTTVEPVGVSVRP